MLVIGPQGERLYVDDGTAKPSDPPAQVTLPLPHPYLPFPLPLPLALTLILPLTRQTPPAQIAAIRSLLLALSSALDGEAATQHIEAVLLSLTLTLSLTPKP